MSKFLRTMIPARVRITSKVYYEVMFVDSFPDDAEQLGECRLDLKQILIRNGMSNTETFKTLIHEIFHAIAQEYDLNLTEKQVMILEKAIYNLLRLNKWI